MNRLIIAALAAAVLSPATARADEETPDTAFVFTDEIVIPVTSVKDQNKSGTCWCFSGTSFFENEIRKAGGDSRPVGDVHRLPLLS